MQTFLEHSTFKTQSRYHLQGKIISSCGLDSPFKVSLMCGYAYGGGLRCELECQKVRQARGEVFEALRIRSNVFHMWGGSD
jgi:hypothetical protein